MTDFMLFEDALEILYDVAEEHLVEHGLDTQVTMAMAVVHDYLVNRLFDGTDEEEN